MVPEGRLKPRDESGFRYGFRYVLRGRRVKRRPEELVDWYDLRGRPVKRWLVTTDHRSSEGGPPRRLRIRRARRRESEEERGRTRTRTIEGLEDCLMDDVVVGGSSEVLSCCAICLKKMRIGCAAKIVSSCSHKFHTECIVMWVKRSHTCPLCRSELPP